MKCAIAWSVLEKRVRAEDLSGSLIWGGVRCRRRAAKASRERSPEVKGKDSGKR